VWLLVRVSFLASLHEPDLVLPVDVSGVGVARHDEGVVDAHARRVQDLGHGADLIDDGHFVGGSGERPETSNSAIF